MSTVAIIGSGMGGLVAGNLLAKKGHEVTIFESHTTPGGYTAGFWRHGFYFESGTLSFESSEMVFGAMKELGLYEKIPFVRQHGRWVFGEFDCVSQSYVDFKNALLKAYPAENDNLRRYFKEVDRMVDAMRSMHKPSNLIEGVVFPFKIVKLISLFKKHAKTTVSEFTEKYFEKDTTLFRLLKDIGYPDMGASILGGTFLSFLEDYWTIETGMQSWADILVENFKSLGGELKLNAKVDGIITKNGTAVGVTSHGKDYAADSVISASDYKKTFLNLIDDKALIPEALKDKIDTAPVSEGFFTVYLGVNLPHEKMKEYLKIPHVYYNDDAQEPDIYDSRDERYFEKALVMFYSPSLRNAALAPEGKSSLMLQTMVPYRWMNNWAADDRENYKRFKEKAKATMIFRASALIPNLNDLIEYEDAATPLTYERYTQNTGGATSAWSWNPNKSFYKSIVGIHVKTPVKNLYIGSCWACQIGGIPGAIGAAKTCAKKIR